jgi:hypothetical protein
MEGRCKGVRAGCPRSIGWIRRTFMSRTPARRSGWRIELLLGGSHPLITPMGLSRATRLAKPALWTTSMTTSTSL